MRRRKAVAVTTIVMGIFALTFLAGASPGWAKGTSGPSAVPFKDIASSGPLTHVYLGNELSCQVAHTGDTDLELYPPDTIPGDCGTLLVDTRADRLYAPDFDAHGTTATGSLGSYTVFTPVSQTPVTGSGTNQDPYKVVTVANAGSSGLVLTETDTYVVGQESYTTSVSVDNTGEPSFNLIIFRAGDCFLGGSDEGTGGVSGSSIACVQEETGRIEEWVPITSGSSYFENNYDEVWARIGSHQAFNNTCECTLDDNGAGLSWTFSLNAGQTKTFSHITTFSPTGNQPLTTQKTADSPTAPPGGQDGYTITIDN